MKLRVRWSKNIFQLFQLEKLFIYDLVMECTIIFENFGQYEMKIFHSSHIFTIKNIDFQTHVSMKPLNVIGFFMEKKKRNALKSQNLCPGSSTLKNNHKTLKKNILK